MLKVESVHVCAEELNALRLEAVKPLGSVAACVIGRSTSSARPSTLSAENQECSKSQPFTSEFSASAASDGTVCVSASW